MRLVGTELKINLNMVPMGNVHLGDCRFDIYAYATVGKGYAITKDECIKVDNDNFIVLVDTAKTGAGSVKFKITINLPDADFDDHYRKEIVMIDTGIVINK